MRVTSEILRFIVARSSRRRHAVLGAGALALAAACAPLARPLVGTPAPAVFPDTRLRDYERIVFRWQFQDGSLVARGEGVARVAPPDSVRLDFFLDGGMGGGTAFLIGDALVVPDGELVQRFLPPPALLWAALGRHAVPPAADTLATLDGTLLRADIGADPVYRATFEAGELRRLEHIAGRRIQEWVSRPSSTAVQYQHERAQRRLTLTITQRGRAEAFDASIWSR